MKKLLLLTLLVVGCEDNSTEPEVHPLVGVWEHSETWVTIGTDKTIVNNFFIKSTFTFYENGVFSSITVSDTATTMAHGTWVTTDYILTINAKVNEDEEYEPWTWEYAIIENRLSLFTDAPDNSSIELIYIKQ